MDSSRYPKGSVRRLLAGQISGRTPNTLRQIKTSMPWIFSNIEKDFDGMASLLLEIERAVFAGIHRACKEPLLKLSWRLSAVTNPRHVERDRTAFVQLGGTALMLNILEPGVFAHGKYSPANSTDNLSLGIRSEGMALLQNEVLAVLREMCYTTFAFSESLTCYDMHLLPRLFQLMQHSTTFYNAVAIAEEIMALREETFPLAPLESSLAPLLVSLSPRQLSFFCRVLALVVYEPEDRMPNPHHHLLTATTTQTQPAPGGGGGGAGAGAGGAGAGAGGGGGGGKVVPDRHVQQLAIQRYNLNQQRATENHARLVDHHNVLPRLVMLLRIQSMQDQTPSPPVGSVWSSSSRGASVLSQEDLGSLLGDEDNAHLLALLFNMHVTRPDHHASGQADPWDHHPLPDLNNLLTPNNGAGNRSAGSPESDLVPVDRPVLRRQLQRMEAEGGGRAEDQAVAGEGEEASELGGPWGNMPRLDSAHQVEVLFVLCALSGGRCKVRVQDALAKLGLVEVLTRMFSTLDWTTPHPDENQPDAGGSGGDMHGMHGPGCACNPDSALKIQYLRLVHNFLDRDEHNRANKLLLLNPQEQAQRHQASSSSSSSPTTDHLVSAATTSSSASSASSSASSSSASSSSKPHARSYLDDRAAASSSASSSHSMSHSNSNSHSNSHSNSNSNSNSQSQSESASSAPSQGGLLTQIIGVLIKSPPTSLYRFWLASCVEAYLRGSSPQDQVLVARTGLMDHLIEEILSHTFKCAASLQVNFDLLGELLKCNRTMFATLDRMLDEKKLGRFIEVIMSNLVDSNVFLRSLLLSLQSFKTHDLSASRVSEEGDSSLLLLSHPLEHTPPASPSNSLSMQQHLHQEDLDLGHLPPTSPSPSTPMMAAPAASSACGVMVSSAGGVGVFLQSQWRRVLCELMTAVDPQEVNQENICVINTALVCLIFQHRQGSLPRCLHALKSQQPLVSLPGDKKALENFQSLLDFWKSYYNSRGRDFVSLEYSSGVMYQEWVGIVDLLRGPASSPLSLSFHLNSGSSLKQASIHDNLFDA